MDANNMGLFLLDSRKKRNLTQKDVAMLCNVSTQAVSKWERGESFPDIEILEKLSILYDISINELINGEKRSKFIDVEKRKIIISLTFSILVFFAYLLSFVQFPYYGMTTILKGYEVIANGISGNIIIYSWIVFLILISYLIINIFLLARVMEKTKLFYIYVYVSYFVIIAFSIFGILNNYYLFLSQAIIFICSTVVFSQNIYNEKNKSLNIGELLVDMTKRMAVYLKKLQELKKEYIYDKRNMKDVREYKVSTYVKPIFYILFDLFYVFVFLFIALAIAGIVMNFIDYRSNLTSAGYVIGGLLFIDLVYMIYSLRYISTILFGVQLKFIWLFNLVSLITLILAYSTSPSYLVYALIILTL
ncbi:MAG: helix-turn-helix domain-containing protein, partial [Candidatus Izemoplasmatales bacterium]